MNLAAHALVLFGTAILAVAAVGLFALPNALARQHASTKAATLALGSILAGVGILGGSPAWWWRSGAVMLLLFVTLPISSHLLARAAARESFTPEELARVPKIGDTHE